MKTRLVTLLIVSGVLASAPLFGNWTRIFSHDDTEAYDSAMDVVSDPDSEGMPNPVREMRDDMRRKYEKAKMIVQDMESSKKKNMGLKPGRVLRALQSDMEQFRSEMRKYRRAMNAGMMGNPLAHMRGYSNESLMDMHMKRMKRTYERFNENYSELM